MSLRDCFVHENKTNGSHCGLSVFHGLCFKFKMGLRRQRFKPDICDSSISSRTLICWGRVCGGICYSELVRRFLVGKKYRLVDLRFAGWAFRITNRGLGNVFACEKFQSLGNVVWESTVCEGPNFTCILWGVSNGVSQLLGVDCCPINVRTAHRMCLWQALWACFSFHSEPLIQINGEDKYYATSITTKTSQFSKFCFYTLGSEDVRFYWVVTLDCCALAGGQKGKQRQGLVCGRPPHRFLLVAITSNE